jgi:hypothetical protein
MSRVQERFSALNEERLGADEEASKWLEVDHLEL